jgi:hypothetical protein
MPVSVFVITAELAFFHILLFHYLNIVNFDPLAAIPLVTEEN